MYDFWRPLGRREAVVDGHYSIDCYLEALSGAYRDWREQGGGEGDRPAGRVRAPSEQLAAIGYHVPFCKMAKKAHAQLRRCDLDDVLGAFDEGREEREGATSFERQVASSLSLCSRVGNVYTGSLYLGLRGHAPRRRRGARRQARSACSPTAAAARASSSPAWWARTPPSASSGRQLDEVLGARERVTVEEYERLMALAPEAPPDIAPAPGGFRFTGVSDHRRQYASG